MDVINAILEGYPKSKKELYVSICPSVMMMCYWLLLQEEVGIETDEDYNVTIPQS